MSGAESFGALAALRRATSVLMRGLDPYDAGLIGEAIELLRAGARVRDELGDSPGHPMAPGVHIALARYFRQRGRPDDRAAVRSHGAVALREYARTVLLQTGAAQVLAAARAALRDALELTRWLLDDHALEDAAKILELGRGPVLHTSTTSADMNHPGIDGGSEPTDGGNHGSSEEVSR